MEALPEPYHEIRELLVGYGRQYDAIQQRQDLSPQRKSELAQVMWLQTNQRLKTLRKQLPTKQRCTAVTRAGTRCTKWARPDYAGQKCAAHVPHVSEW